MVRKDATGQEYGSDSLDPPLWPDTTYLLTGDSHGKALGCLDEFLHTQADRKVKDPIKRALLQRDLWWLFDWSAQSSDHQRNRRELQERLAEALRRIAMTPEEIRSLPDTYSQAIKAKKFAENYDPAHPSHPFLPPELFEADGPWVCIRAAPTAIAHVQAFSGRSRFLVFIRLPGGRRATFEYLQRLWSFPEPLTIRGDPQADGNLNLRVPQFPVGTQVALVRQMILFDRESSLVATSLTESVQIRVYHSITSGSPYMNYQNGPASKDQDVFEFRMNKQALLKGAAGGLVAVAPSEKEFAMFGFPGLDPLEPSARFAGHNVEILKSCGLCHADAGIHSFQSRRKLIEGLEPSDRPGTAGYGGIDFETESTLWWKRSRYDWGLLTGLWRAAPKL